MSEIELTVEHINTLARSWPCIEFNGTKYFRADTCVSKEKLEELIGWMDSHMGLTKDKIRGRLREVMK